MHPETRCPYRRLPRFLPVGVPAGGTVPILDQYIIDSLIAAGHLSVRARSGVLSQSDIDSLIALVEGETGAVLDRAEFAKRVEFIVISYVCRDSKDSLVSTAQSRVVKLEHALRTALQAFENTRHVRYARAVVGGYVEDRKKGQDPWECARSRIVEQLSMVEQASAHLARMPRGRHVPRNFAFVAFTVSLATLCKEITGDERAAASGVLLKLVEAILKIVEPVHSKMRSRDALRKRVDRAIKLARGLKWADI